MKTTEMLGQKFGKLAVVSRADNRKSQAYWLCCCDCGNTVECRGADLRYGRTKSCGCLRFARRLQGDYIGRVLRTYRWDANARQLTFNISREEFEKLIFLDCHYCGRKPSQSVKIGKDYKEWHPTFRYNGIDRVDNLKGYEIGNLVPCCNQCNKAKRDTSYNEFLEWARAVSKLHPETMSKGAA